MKELRIIGASGHGKVIADIAMKSGKYSSISFYDDNEEITEVAGFHCHGKVSLLSKAPQTDDVIVAIGNATVRENLMKQVVEQGFNMPILVHPQAVVANDVTLGAGTVVMAGAVINCGARIGCGVIINTSSSVDHDSVVQDYAHISVGSHLAGNVYVGRRSWIGAGATVINNINICEDTMIGAGAVVIKNVTKSGTYVGVPAKKIK